MCGSLELEVCVSAVLFDLVYSSQRQLNKLNTVPFRERASFETRGLGPLWDDNNRFKPGTVTLRLVTRGAAPAAAEAEAGRPWFEKNGGGVELLSLRVVTSG